MIAILNRFIINARVAAALALLFVSAGSVALAAGDVTEIKSIRHWKGESSIRFVLDLGGPVEFTSSRLANPDRLFFDIRKARLQKGIAKTVEVQHDAVKSVRLGQFSADTARVVFDLKDGRCDFKAFTLEDPWRLVIDISVRHDGKGKEPLRTEKPSEAPPKAGRPVERFIQRTVVLDAGHGGHDPGAVGPTKLYEKDVVLDIAKRVKAILSKGRPEYSIILTRDRDVFLKLEERTEIANRAGADLFVSVHANASANRKARGMETYFLNYTNNGEALKVAARENAVSLKKMKQAQSELGIIFAALESQHKRDESVKLAGNIQKSMVSRVSKRYPAAADHGVKWAPFYVLVGAKMASSLVEVSFISNREEEKLLRTDGYRQMLAQSIADGIHAYFASQPALQLVKDDSDRTSARPIAYKRPTR